MESSRSRDMLSKLHQGRHHATNGSKGLSGNISPNLDKHWQVRRAYHGLYDINYPLAMLLVQEVRSEPLKSSQAHDSDLRQVG